MKTKLVKHPIVLSYVFGILIFYWLSLGNVAPIVISRFNIFISARSLVGTLLFMTIASSLFLYYKIPKRRLSVYELFLNSLLPTLCHYVLKVIDYNFTLVVSFVVLVALLILGIYFLQKYARVKKVRVIYFARHIVAFCVVLLIIPGYLYYQYEKPIQEYVSSSLELEEEIQEVAGDFNEVKTELHNKDWGKLSLEKKSEILFKVLEEEAVSLGVDTPKLVIKDLDSETKMGLYTHEDKTIVLNSYHVGKYSIEESLMTVLHELFHSYQHSVIDIMSNFDKNVYGENFYFKKAEIWKAAKESYVQDKKTLKGYETNALEEDARAYAEKTVTEKYGFELPEKQS